MWWLFPVALVAALGLGYWLFLSPTSQLFGHFPYGARTTQRVVALTFDDGPNEPYTSELLDLLKREQVAATFFVVGVNLAKHPETVKRATREGHVIGNHSLSHQFRKYFTGLSFNSEISANQQLIATTTGRTPALFRPPWLFRTPWLLASLRKFKLQPISGTFVNNREIFQPSAETIAATAYRRTKNGTILIFHDGYNAKGGPRQATITAVGQLIDRLRADGYKFVTVDQLLDVPAYQTTAAPSPKSP